MLGVINDEDTHYWHSLTDGDVFYMLRDDIEFKVRYTEFSGFTPDKNIIYDKFAIQYKLILRKKHIDNLNKLKDYDYR